MSHTPNLDPSEIAKFSDLARHWWDKSGPCKPLHSINPVRLYFVQQQLNIVGKSVLDIGCGGGIFSESLAAAGADVTGIDMSAAALEVARSHANTQGLQLNYELATAEEFAVQHPQQFDVITCMELIEHVPNPMALVQACAALVKPGGYVFFSTINRTAKAYLYTILGAEYILGVLPKGTHDYGKFIKPSELCAGLREASLSVKALKGINYQLNGMATLIDEMRVNYILAATL